MSVIADFSLAAEEFVLGYTVVAVPDIDLEVERMVAYAEEGLTPYFRVIAPEEGLDAFEGTLDEDDTVIDLDILETFEEERFYRAPTDGRVSRTSWMHSDGPRGRYSMRSSRTGPGSYGCSSPIASRSRPFMICSLRDSPRT